MRNRALAGLAVLLCAGLLGTRSAAALQLHTSIDLNYLYEQQHEAGDVDASASYTQKYEIKYETTLTSAFDFLGAVRLELEDRWHLREANASRVAPTLEMQAKGSQASLRVAYEGSIATTDAFRESGESSTYTNSLSSDLLMTPAYWPELKLKYQRRRDYEEQARDSTTESVDVTLLKDIGALRLDLNVKRERTDGLLPELVVNENEGWTGKATYKEILYGGTQFELAYETAQSHIEDRTRGVFVGSTEASTQQVKTRLKNSLAITPRMSLALSWEYGFQQDRLVLEYDYKVDNKYLLGLRWELLDWVKISADAGRDTSLTVNDVGLDDERKVTDTIKGQVDVEPASWLRLAGRVESKNERAVAQSTGGSIDQDQDDKFEIVVRNNLGELWDLTLNATGSETHADGWLTKRENKLKGDLKVKFLDLTVQPSYEAIRTTEWEPAIEDPSRQVQTREAKLTLEYKLVLVNLLNATFTHTYDVKSDLELDEVLAFERKLQFNEDTRLNVANLELVRGLRLEGEINRRASDTQNDTDPELIEVSYALKLDWRLERLGLSSTFKYNDKGDTFDDLSFNTKIDWKGDRLDLSGEYQFDKIFADLTDEARKLNLKLAYKF